MSDDAFDSNVLIYLVDETDARKREIAERLVARAIEEETGSIGYQVVQETLNVLTTKVAVRATPEHAAALFATLLTPLWNVMPTQDLYLRALGLRVRLGYSFYDCLVIAAALEAGCSRLYTEDMQHGQRIDGLVIENPFLEAAPA